MSSPFLALSLGLVTAASVACASTERDAPADDEEVSATSTVGPTSGSLATGAASSGSSSGTTSSTTITAGGAGGTVGSTATSGGDGAGGAGGSPSLPVGQCVSDADCPDGPLGAMCNRTAPGGICLACGGDDDNCPSHAECTRFGACAVSCPNGLCPPGQTCDSFGRCKVLTCSAGVCPDTRFGCNGSLCARAPCDAGQACPDQTTCLSGLCIEDHSL